MYAYTVVTIQFQQPQFTGTEDSRVLEATVVLSGGTVSFPFAVTVTPSSGTATGLTLLVTSRDLISLIFTAGSDFDAMPVTAVFLPGDQSQVVQIPLVCDADVEGTETFSMSLSVNVTNSRLRFGTQRTAIGNIEDSTGKCSVTAFMQLIYVSCFAVTVSFDNPSYNVNEASRSVQLTVVFSQPTFQRFGIIVSTMDGTATGNYGNHVLGIVFID